MKFLDAIVPDSVIRSAILDQFFAVQDTRYGGQNSAVGYTTTWGNSPAEPVPNSFVGYVEGGLYGNGIVFSLELKRIQVFSQARFQFQQMRNGRPGDLFGTPALSILERPWPGGTTGDLLARMLQDAGAAGNNFETVIDDEVVRLRPDWVEIILKPRIRPLSIRQTDVHIGYEQVGIFYYEGGIGESEPAVFLAGEYSHFAPIPDPLATYRGMSWLTPVIRELQADSAATKHKLKFFENAATPNLAVSLPKELTPDQFKAFVAEMDKKHKGVDNAYKTLYTGGGADVTVVGADMKQLDFKATQGAGETRLAAAAGVHPVVAGLSEGMQGSSLNAGNYTAAKRAFVDTTIRHLWQNAAGSLESLVPAPDGARLWYDARDIPFLLDDMKDRAEIQATQATAVRQLLDAGFTADSVKAAILAEDWNLLQHSNLFSVQLQPPGTVQQPPEAEPEQTRTVIGRQLNPGQKRDPDGQFSDGVFSARVAGDKLGLARRIKLPAGGTLVASTKVQGNRYADRSAVLAALDTPSGRRVRLGVVHNEDSRRWAAANRGGTVDMSAEQAQSVAKGLGDVREQAQRAAKDYRRDVKAEYERQRAAGGEIDYSTMPDWENIRADGVIRAGDWGDVAWHIEANESGGSVVDEIPDVEVGVAVRVKPAGAGADWTMFDQSEDFLDNDPASLGRLIKELDRLSGKE